MHQSRLGVSTGITAPLLDRAGSASVERGVEAYRDIGEGEPMGDDRSERHTPGCDEVESTGEPERPSEEPWLQTKANVSSRAIAAATSRVWGSKLSSTSPIQAPGAGRGRALEQILSTRCLEYDIGVWLRPIAGAEVRPQRPRRGKARERFRARADDGHLTGAARPCELGDGLPDGACAEHGHPRPRRDGASLDRVTGRPCRSSAASSSSTWSGSGKRSTPEPSRAREAAGARDAEVLEARAVGHPPVPARPHRRRSRSSAGRRLDRRAQGRRRPLRPRRSLRRPGAPGAGGGTGRRRAGDRRGTRAGRRRDPGSANPDDSPPGPRDGVRHLLDADLVRAVEDGCGTWNIYQREVSHRRLRARHRRRSSGVAPRSWLWTDGCSAVPAGRSRRWPEHDRAEHDPAAWLEAALQPARRQSHKRVPPAIEAVGVGALGLGPDRRRVPYAAHRRFSSRSTRAEKQRAALADEVTHDHALPKLLWLAEHDPEGRAGVSRPRCDGLPGHLPDGRADDGHGDGGRLLPRERDGPFAPDAGRSVRGCGRGDSSGRRGARDRGGDSVAAGGYDTHVDVAGAGVSRPGDGCLRSGARSPCASASVRRSTVPG